MKTETNSKGNDAVIQTLRKLSESMCWENWQNANGEFFSVLEVLYCKLEWVREHFEAGHEDTEMGDIIEDVQQVIESMQKIKKYNAI